MTASLIAVLGPAARAAASASGASSTSTPEWIALAGAVFAAAAAGASWASVRLNRRQWLLSQQPHLTLQLRIDGAGERVLSILNAGPGPARGVRFCVSAGEEYASGYAGSEFGGYLAPGQRAALSLQLSAGSHDRTRGVAVCWDAVGRVQRFTDAGGRETHDWKEGDAETATDPLEAFKSAFGTAALQGLRRVGGRGHRAP